MSAGAVAQLLAAGAMAALLTGRASCPEYGAALWGAVCLLGLLLAIDPGDEERP